MDIRVIEQHYLKAINSLFASLQYIKYHQNCTIEQKIASIDSWIGHLQKLKRYLVFAKYNQVEGPKK